jgi:hypothetical protein
MSTTQRDPVFDAVGEPNALQQIPLSPSDLQPSPFLFFESSSGLVGFSSISSIQITEVN